MVYLLIEGGRLGTRHAVAARGLPLRLCVDNGRVFHSQQLARIAASLGILLVHTPPYQPQGRGKIERFFRSLREQFLASLDPKPLLSLEALNQRLGTWIETVYHRSVHSALGTTPLLCWQRDIEQIRQLPPATDLRRLFFYRLLRLIRRDATFLLRNRFYVPAKLRVSVSWWVRSVVCGRLGPE
jgi:transposase InsO family protein